MTVCLEFEMNSWTTTPAEEAPAVEHGDYLGEDLFLLHYVNPEEQYSDRNLSLELFFKFLVPT